MHAKGLPPDNPETEVQTYFQIIHVCAVKFYIRRDWNVIQSHKPTINFSRKKLKRF